jgi:hypothetical protein
VTTAATSAAASVLLPAAADPATPPERLRRIAEQVGWPSRRLDDARMVVHDALAANPSVPPDVLARLMPFCPDALCRNPVLPLLALESPDFFAADPAGAARLLRSPLLPAVVARQIEVTAPADSPDLAADARRHVSVAGEAGDGWLGEVRDYWRARVAAAPPDERLEYAGLSAAAGVLPSVAADPDVTVRLLRAADPDAGPSERARLATDPSWHVRLAAALNPLTAAKTRLYHLGRLSREAFGNARLVEYGRRHPETKADALNLVAQASLERARRVGQVRELPLWTFAALARADDLSPAMRLLAADSGVWWQRLGAAMGLRPESGEPDLRASAVDALRALSDDGNRLVRAAASARRRGEAVDL